MTPTGGTTGARTGSLTSLLLLAVRPVAGAMFPGLALELAEIWAG